MGCARSNVSHHCRGLCRACYAVWMRQRRLWRERSEKMAEGIKIRSGRDFARLLGRKLYGTNPFCNRCGLRRGQRMDMPVNEKILIHHIDGNPENNSPTNLEPLCPRCHKKHHLALVHK